MKLLVSACLMGVGCRYDGKSNELPQLAELLTRLDCIPACAEVFLHQIRLRFLIIHIQRVILGIQYPFFGQFLHCPNICRPADHKKRRHDCKSKQDL